jgi:hypothetical protein
MSTKDKPAEGGKAAPDATTDKAAPAAAESSEERQEEARGPSRADQVRHALARIRGNVSTARRRLDLHALADAVTELLDLLEPPADA